MEFEMRNILTGIPSIHVIYTSQDLQMGKFEIKLNSQNTRFFIKNSLIKTWTYLVLGK